MRTGRQGYAWGAVVLVARTVLEWRSPPPGMAGAEPSDRCRAGAPAGRSSAFLARPDIDATNRRAEQAIRSPVEPSRHTASAGWFRSIPRHLTSARSRAPHLGGWRTTVLIDQSSGRHPCWRQASGFFPPGTSSLSSVSPPRDKHCKRSLGEGLLCWKVDHIQQPPQILLRMNRKEEGATT